MDDRLRLNVGDKATVINRQCEHEFDIGETIVIIRRNSNNYYATNGYNSWYVEDDELRPIHISNKKRRQNAKRI